MKQKPIYLDYAAATPLDERVLLAMKPYFSEDFYNPSAGYMPALKVRQAVEEARKSVAHWLGARSSEIIFTAGGTEANNLAIRGVMEAFPMTEIITSSIEHDSVLAPAELYKHVQAPVLEDGTIDITLLGELITDMTSLISVMYVNNEIGTIQPIKEISQLVEKVRRERRIKGNHLPLYFHTDAAQAGNYLDLHVSRLGVDLMTINGGKIYGPKQSGALFVKSGVILKPQLLGGGQERNMRSGTENVAGIIGLSKALDLAQSDRKNESERLAKLQNEFFSSIAAKIPGAIFNGSMRRRLVNNVHISFPGADNERVLVQLDEQGIYAAAGSACSASSDEPSHVLKAIAVSDELAQSSLRFSLGRPTTEADIHLVVSTLVSLVA